MVTYEERRRVAETLVAEWRWSRPESGWDDVRPFASERVGQRRGSLRPARKSPKDDEIGLDAQGRPVIVRTDHLETVFTYAPDRIDVARLNPEHNAYGDGVLELDGDRPRAWRGPHEDAETYEYDNDGRLVRILRPGRSLETFSYGADGALFAIDCEWAGGVSRRTWRRR